MEHAMRRLARSLATFLTVSCVLAVPAVGEAADGPARATERPKVYFDFLLGGSMVHEDRGNRLTHRSQSSFATPTAGLRLGGVVARHHLVGGLLQVDWRSTQKVLDSHGGNQKWGAISSYYLGPEYRYITRFGLYFGGSLGFNYTLADDDVGGGGSPDCSAYKCVARHMQETDDQGVPGVGVRAVVGYQLRIRRTLAVSFEAFGGVRHGEDEDDVDMTTPTYGLAMGIGF